MNISKLVLIVFLFVSIVTTAKAQDASGKENRKVSKNSYFLKSNLLYDITSTINLGFEMQTGNKTSLDLSGNINPFSFNDNRKWKHILAQPEFRWWTKQVFDGHFFGIHAHWAYFNVGNLPNPPFTQYMEDYRFEGWLAGAGFSYGYRWNFKNPRWAIEAVVGVGYAYLDYEKYDCENCGAKLDETTKNYFGPTKAAVNIVYRLGKNETEQKNINTEQKNIPHIKKPNFKVSFAEFNGNYKEQKQQAVELYLKFKFRENKVDYDFADNKQELKKVADAIALTNEDERNSITKITVDGYTCLLGLVKKNEMLSEERAKSAAELLIEKCNLPNNIVSYKGYGEDWKTVESWVKHSNFKEKEEVLSIIEDFNDLQVREVMIRQISNGAVYKKMQSEIFESMRRVDCNIYYQQTSRNDSEITEIYNNSPQELSEEELIIVAKKYEKGSEEYSKAIEVIAKKYQKNDIANINAAANAISKGDRISAADYLLKVENKNAEYWNNMAILSFMNNDKETASVCLQKAIDEGSTEASENILELKKFNKK